MCREMAEQREAREGRSRWRRDESLPLKPAARSKWAGPAQRFLCWMDGWMDRRLTAVVYCIIVGIVEC